MKFTQLGNNGPRISALGMGCGDLTTKDIEIEKEGIATIQAALDSGINLLNTADFYGMGQSESIIGKAIKGRRDQAFLSVKFGMMMSPSGQFLGLDGRPESVKNFASYSLQRLGVDVIDLYQPGRPDPNVPYEETIGAIADLIKEGKVRYLGVSEVGVDHLRRANAVHPVTALEIEYSLACRFIEAEILPTARELGIGVIPYRILADGLLTGNITEEPKGFLTPPRMQGNNLKHNLNLVQTLIQISKDKGLTAAQGATAWLLSRGQDIVPLVGLKRRARLIDNLKALDVSFSQQELAQLDLCFSQQNIQGNRYPDFVMNFAAQ